MTATDEKAWMIASARAALKAARDMLELGHYAASIREGQSCVEYCARAVVASYTEPSWGHSHARDLDKMLLHVGHEIRRQHDAATLAALRLLADDDREMAPWHTRAVYGYRDHQQVFHPPTEVCTQAVAERAVLLAERSLATAEAFLVVR